MQTTSPRTVVGLVVIGAAVGWTILALFRAGTTAVPQLAWSAAAGLLFYAVLLFGGAWYMFDRVHRKARRVDAILAVRLLLLAKASVLVGALVLGGYLGFGLHRLRLASEGFSSGQVLVALLTAGTAVLVLVGALLLERACKVPDGPDDDNGTTNGTTDSA